eukprot:gnl/TRDRNA2_/TRDRNA2_154102_c1_seq1.p2 gnl/TRDRNA2_/TRDRNA2_154102_c1~~gnl/TRDRNA2_/TRDRNA2_154102_c1_seq1.p2  ORF type:complete len:268 (+),score=73.73 gnl/TRDRNA2_/TRDRNA2_154102_c1_seq1:120-806(+)
MEGVVASSDDTVMAMLEKICKTLIDAKKELDALDAKVGDADCGSTMATAAAKVLEEKDKLPLADPKATCACLSSILGKVMGGSSGVLMSIMFMGMEESFARQTKPPAGAVTRRRSAMLPAYFVEPSGSKGSWAVSGAEAFADGLDAMMDAGGAKPGSRTMLDALVPAAEALAAGKGFAGAKAAAAEGSEKTKSMAPKAGRTENVPEKKWKGVPDPGSVAAAKVFAALE